MDQGASKNHRRCRTIEEVLPFWPRNQSRSTSHAAVAGPNTLLWRLDWNCRKDPSKSICTSPVWRQGWSPVHCPWGTSWRSSWGSKLFSTSNANTQSTVISNTHSSSSMKRRTRIQTSTSPSAYKHRIDVGNSSHRRIADAKTRPSQR